MIVKKSVILRFLRSRIRSVDRSLVPFFRAPSAKRKPAIHAGVMVPDSPLVIVKLLQILHVCVLEVLYNFSVGRQLLRHGSGHFDEFLLIHVVSELRGFVQIICNQKFFSRRFGFQGRPDASLFILRRQN